MKKLKVVILGQGRSGLNIHCAWLKNDERFVIAGVVDALPERREKAAALFGCDVYEDYRELLGRNDIDLVVNALPSCLHPSVTIDLLRHGFHVMTEKPMAATVAQVDEMIRASEETGRMLAVFQQSRFAGFYRKVKEVLASGKLGRVIQISIQYDGFARRWDWQTCQEYYGGSLYNTGPHPVDQALELLNYPNGMPDIFCKLDRVNTFGDAEDYVKLILTAPERPLVDVEISNCSAYPNFRYQVQGSCGGLQGSDKELKWRYFKPEEAPEQRLIKTPLMSADGEPVYCSERLTWYEESWTAEDRDTPFDFAVERIYGTVYEHLVNGIPLVVTPYQVRQQIAVMEKCHLLNPMSRMGG